MIEELAGVEHTDAGGTDHVYRAGTRWAATGSPDARTSAFMTRLAALAAEMDIGNEERPEMPGSRSGEHREAHRFWKDWPACT